MDTNALKKFAQEARRDLLEQVEARLEQVLTTDSVELREKLGIVNELRQQLKEKSKENLIEEVAYTWFNRLCALRYMDVNQITKVGVVSPIPGFTQPEIMQEAKQGIFDPDWRLEQSRVQGLLNGAIPSANPEQEAYRLLLVAVCNSYAEEMDFLFPQIEGITELLMPEDLLSTQSVLHAVREALTEDVCQDVEVIGWLYQFYISEKKDKVMGNKGKVAKEDIPAVTQLFTPHWIVRYMVENSLGRLWLLNHPESKIREKMEYYVPVNPHLNPLPGGEEAFSPLPPGEGQGEGKKAQGEGERAQGEGKKPLSPAILQRCRDLRKNATDAEQLLWACLRDRNLAGYKFRRQHPVDNYILDFYCHEARLCVELDGGGHTEPDQQDYDAERTAFLESQGIEVLRYWNHEVMEDLELVLETILEKCQTKNPHLNPLPGGEEEKTLSPRERAQGEGNEESFLKVDSPEDLKILDPACGSGHILTYAFDLLVAIYEEMGYDPISIPKLILEKNLYGIEIDKRAAMLSSFALMMKAVEKDKRFFRRGVQPNILEMEDVSFEPQEVKAYMEKVGEDLWTQELWEGLQQFNNAEMFGSLIQPALKDIPELRERLKAKGVFEDLFLAETNRKVLKVLAMSKYLSPRYHVVVANPPYFSKGMDSEFKQYAKDHFPDFKNDTFAMFVKRNLELAIAGGQLGFMTPFVWMFLSSYEKMREFLIENKTITSLVQLEYSGFAWATVPICTFTLENNHDPKYLGGYIRLSDFRGAENQAPRTKEAISNPNSGWFYKSSANNFKKIPGVPIAYWVSNNFLSSFENNNLLGDILNAKTGVTTGNNNLHVRYWFEVDRNNLNLCAKNRKETTEYPQKWYPLNSGGKFKKWYGNTENIIEWKNDGEIIRARNNSNIRNQDFFFKEGLTWSKITSANLSVRYSPPGFMFDAVGLMAFPNSEIIHNILALLNSKIVRVYAKAFNPTLSILIGDLNRIPYIKLSEEDANKIKHNVIKLIRLTQMDYDFYEISWDFDINPIILDISFPCQKKIADRYEELMRVSNK